jgi:hypothetical protein
MLMAKSNLLQGLRWIVGLVLITYVAIALTPMKATIGRHSPRTASLFSPPSFNFSHMYSSGNVLGFSVGMSRQGLFQTLEQNYSDSADLIVNCIVTTSESVVPITSDTNVAATYGGGDQLCARLDSERLAFHVDFEDDIVSGIRIVFVRNEFP